MELKIYCGTFPVGSEHVEAVIATSKPLPDEFKASTAKPSPQAAEIAAAFPDSVFVKDGPTYRKAQPANTAGHPAL